MRKFLRWGAGLLALTGLLFTASSVQAEGIGGYAVGASQSEFQKDKKVSYFDLRLKPDQKTEVAIKIINSSDKDATFTVHANTAITNDNGIIDYTRTNITPDKTLAHPFSELAKVSQEHVSVGAKSEKEVPITIQMPSQKFDGMILGGIYVTKEVAEEDKKENGYTSQYSYAKPVILTESDSQIIPELKLNKVEAKSLNYQQVVTANLQNPEPVNMQKLVIDGKIFKKGSDKAIIENKQEDRQFAPNSNFNFTFPFEKELDAGEYKLDLDVLNDKGKKWHFTKDFSISKKQTKQIAEQNKWTDGNQLSTVNWWYIGILALLVLIVVLLLLLLLKKRKEEARDK
ncbi:MAG: DUF916 and DUF3324 domain-containing protein [Lactobacillales bacterium]|nr:DUF916 and DUF3324 domain-containing protein [Lactobacillales bacterium]